MHISPYDESLDEPATRKPSRNIRTHLRVVSRQWPMFPSLDHDAWLLLMAVNKKWKPLQERWRGGQPAVPFGLAETARACDCSMARAPKLFDQLLDCGMIARANRGFISMTEEGIAAVMAAEGLVS